MFQLYSKEQFVPTIFNIKELSNSDDDSICSKFKLVYHNKGAFIIKFTYVYVRHFAEANLKNLKLSESLVKIYVHLSAL